jgi:hypothetical protein
MSSFAATNSGKCARGFFDRSKVDVVIEALVERSIGGGASLPDNGRGRDRTNAVASPEGRGTARVEMEGGNVRQKAK